MPAQGVGSRRRARCPKPRALRQGRSGVSNALQANGWVRFVTHLHCSCGGKVERPTIPYAQLGGRLSAHLTEILHGSKSHRRLRMHRRSLLNRVPGPAETAGVTVRRLRWKLE